MQREADADASLFETADIGSPENLHLVNWTY